MTHAAKILAHSISPNGDELITYEVVLPRIVLAEFNTHKEFSRNSASSRAIPVKKMLQMVMENPYIPTSWGKNQKGMQAGEDVHEEVAAQATANWMHARDAAVKHTQQLLNCGIHKQLINRLLEPFMWHTIIMTSSLPGLMNFFHLRDHHMAHPDIRIPAHIMHELWKASTPEKFVHGMNRWHLPLFFPEDEQLVANYMLAHEPDGTCGRFTEVCCMISAGRCARVSYLTHEGKRDIDADIGLCDGLLGNGHMSPLEHPARPMTKAELNTYRMYHYTLEDGHVFDSRVPWIFGTPISKPSGDSKIAHTRISHRCGNFDGWIQFRKTIPSEHDKMAPYAQGSKGQHE